jgi:anti-sigma-K factor RskA
MTTPMNDRLADLLIARAIRGIDESENAELSRWLAEAGGDDLTFERAASAVQVAYTPLVPMPPAVTSKVAEAADRFVAEPPSPVVPRSAPARPASARRVSAWAPWLAAAACLLLAIGGWLRRPGPDSGGRSASELRAALLGEEGVVVLPWSATLDPSAAGATGDLVWSPAKQKGYMRFRGLAANDPKREQYQLWIFDKQQDERFPVDGGVFDVDKTTGDVIVPIVAKIHVAEPTLFAVTVEKPGGVVVSKRERIVVTATRKTG